MASIKKTEEALNILKNYNGENPYILMLKRDMFVYEDPDAIGDFQIDYILKNFDYKRKEINRITEIPKWYGEDRKEKWGITDFTPEKLFVTTAPAATIHFLPKLTPGNIIQFSPSQQPSPILTGPTSNGLSA